MHLNRNNPNNPLFTVCTKPFLSREVVRSVLGFVKVCAITMMVLTLLYAHVLTVCSQVETVRPLLPVLIEGSSKWLIYPFFIFCCVVVPKQDYYCGRMMRAITSAPKFESFSKCLCADSTQRLAHSMLLEDKTTAFI